MKTLIDSYSELNYATNLPLTDTTTMAGQSFLGKYGYLNSTTWYLAKSVNGTGTIVAKLYAHSGTFGSSSLPTGDPIAISDPIDISSLSIDYSLVTFYFPGVVLIQDINYVMVLEYTIGAESSNVKVGLDTTTSGHAGNGMKYSGSWSEYPNYDFCFYVYITDFSKRYEYKIYEPDGTYITTITDVVDRPQFTSYINSGLGEMTIRLPRSIFSFDETVSIAQNNQVKVVCYDDNETEMVIYNGYISKYAPVLDKGKEYVTVTCLSYVTELERFMFEDASGNTTLAYNSVDPSNILIDVLDKFSVAGGHSNYLTSTDQSLGDTSNSWNFASDYWVAQPFTPTEPHLFKVGLQLKKLGSPTGNLTIELQTDSSGSPSGTVLATATIDVATLTTDFVEYLFSFPCTLTPGTQYFVCLKGQSAWGSTNTVYTGYLIGNGFAAMKFGPGNFSTSLTSVQISLKTYYTSVDLTDTVVTYEFNTYTVKEALDKIVELAPSGFYYFLDAENVVNFKPKSSTADHVFVLGRDVISIIPEKSVENLCNRLYFTGGEVAGVPLFKKYDRSSSIATYGLYAQKMIDSRVTDETTMDIIAGAYLDRLDAPETRTTVEIRNLGIDGRGYDIESIKPGQTCKIIGYDSKASNLWDQAIWDSDKWNYDITAVSSTTQQIMKVSYQPHKVILEISSTIPNISHRVDDIKRNLTKLQTADNPSAPTT
ncbi:MAG: hypothetical protein AB9866_18995 [Syntrophobacteraceae bacterium]